MNKRQKIRELKDVYKSCSEMLELPLTEDERKAYSLLLEVTKKELFELYNKKL